MVQFQKQDLVLPWIFHFILVIFLLIFAIIPFQSLHFNNQIFDSMLNQFWNEPIDSIILLENPDLGCPGTHPNNLFTFDIEFAKGCLDSSNQNICEGYCSIDNKCSGQNIDPVPKQTFNRWPILLNSNTPPDSKIIKLCYSTISSLYLQNITSTTEKRSCDLQTSKICQSAPNALQFCIPQASKCPITGFDFLSDGAKAQNKSEFLKITETLSLYIYRSTYHFPLIQTQISESTADSGCLDSSVSNLSPGRKSHPLIRPKHEFNCGSIIDYRFKSSQLQVGEQSLFKANNYAINLPPNYQTTDNFIYKFYSKSYHSIKPSCWDTDHLSEFFKLQNYKALFTQQIIIVVLISIYFFALIIIAIFIKSCKTDHIQQKLYSESNGLKILIIQTSIRLLLGVTHVTFVIQSLQESKLIYQVADVLISQLCLDTIDGPQAIQISSNYKQILIIQIICTTSFILSIGLEVVLWQHVQKKIQLRDSSSSQNNQNNLQQYGIQQIENESANIEAQNAQNNSIQLNQNDIESNNLNINNPINNNNNNINNPNNIENRHILIRNNLSRNNRNNSLINRNIPPNNNELPPIRPQLQQQIQQQQQIAQEGQAVHQGTIRSLQPNLRTNLNNRQLQDIELSRANVQQSQQRQMEEVKQIIKNQEVQKLQQEQILKEQELLRMVDFRDFPIYQFDQNNDDQLTGPKILAECVICLENDPPPLYTKCCYQPLHDTCNVITIVNCPCCRHVGRPKLEYVIRRENRAFKQLKNNQFDDFPPDYIDQ